MKKLFLSLVILSVLAGCSPAPSKTTAGAPGTQPTTQATKVSKLKLETQDDKGNAKAELVNASGSSEGGKTISILGDYAATQIGLNAENYDGSKFTYVFVDGKENSKHQFGEMTQTNITLQGDDLKEGLHTVEVIQWSEDDMKGEVLQYKKFQYEVKK